MITLSLLAWAGMIVHNLAELPDLAWYRPEVAIPTGISSILVLGWFKQPEFRRYWTWLLIAWTSIHLIVGGVLSVLPFAFWPFYPAQSFSHYLVHVVYSAAQIPLLVLLKGQLQRSTRPGGPTG